MFCGLMMIFSFTTLNADLAFGQRCSDQLRFILLDSLSSGEAIEFNYDADRANNTYELKGRYFDKLVSMNVKLEGGVTLGYEIRVDQVVRSRGADSVEASRFVKPLRYIDHGEFHTGCGGVFVMTILRQTMYVDDSAWQSMDSMTIRFDNLHEEELAVLIPYSPGRHLVTTGRHYSFELDKMFANSAAQHSNVRTKLAQYYRGERLLESYEITPIEWRDRIGRWLSSAR